MDSDFTDGGRTFSRQVRIEILPDLFGFPDCRFAQVDEQDFLCDACGKGFSTAAGLAAHARAQHVGDRPFACPQCAKAFATREGLRSHQLVHSGVRRFECDLCAKRFLRKQEMQQHRLIHTGEKPHVCAVCRKGFSLREKLKRHMLTHTEVRPFGCERCALKFKSPRDLKLHVRRHEGVKPYMCEWCSKCFFTTTHLRLHQRTHTGEKPYHCHACPMQYSNKDSFLKHVRSHDVHSESETGSNPPTADENSSPVRKRVRAKSYWCGKCRRRFCSREKWEIHQCPRPLMFTCDTCREDFCEKRELEEHLPYHRREKPYACFVCGLAFFRSPNLKLHLSVVHAEARSYPCDHCEKTFATREYLRKHLKTHSARRHACESCGEIFALKRELQAHSREHYEAIKTLQKEKKLAEEKKKVKQENNKFPRLESLRYHVLRHFGTKPYYCELCSETFKDKYYLLRHKRIHARENPDACPVCHVQYSGRDCFLKHFHNMDDDEDKSAKMTFEGQQTSDEVANGVESEETGTEELSRVEADPSVVSDSSGEEFRIKQHVSDSEEVTLDERKVSFVVKTADSNMAVGEVTLADSRSNTPTRDERFAKGEESNLHQPGEEVPKRCELQNHHMAPGRPFVCDVCAKRFCAIQDLRDHFRLHSDEKAFPCYKCAERFISPEELRIHFAVHLKPHACAYCGERFASKKLLRQHSFSHIEAHECDLCGKSFTRARDLKLHLLRHSFDHTKRFACDACDVRFAHVTDLVAHRRTHVEKVDTLVNSAERT